MLLLTACQSLTSNTLPDVKEYTKAQQKQAIKEINSNSCPMIGDVFMGDYYIMRQQIRSMQ
jgi:hypothetical protein